MKETGPVFGVSSAMSCLKLLSQIPYKTDLNIHHMYIHGCDKSCPNMAVLYTLMLAMAEYSILGIGFPPSNLLVGLAKKKSRVWVNSKIMLAR